MITFKFELTPFERVTHLTFCSIWLHTMPNEYRCSKYYHRFSKISAPISLSFRTLIDESKNFRLHTKLWTWFRLFCFFTKIGHFVMSYTQFAYRVFLDFIKFARFYQFFLFTCLLVYNCITWGWNCWVTVNNTFNTCMFELCVTFTRFFEVMLQQQNFLL